MLDIFSYFRRRRNGETRQAPAAAEEAIDLATIGGAINGTYLDIASIPVRGENPRPKRRARSQRQRPKRWPAPMR